MERVRQETRQERHQARSAGTRRPVRLPQRARRDPSPVHRPGPKQLWLSDITEHRTGQGKLYLCAIQDVYYHRIVGYSIGDRMNPRLTVAVLNNAVARRGEVAGCIVHTDRGSQFDPGMSCPHCTATPWSSVPWAGSG